MSRATQTNTMGAYSHDIAPPNNVKRISTTSFMSLPPLPQLHWMCIKYPLILALVNNFHPFHLPYSRASPRPPPAGPAGQPASRVQREPLFSANQNRGRATRVTSIRLSLSLSVSTFRIRSFAAGSGARAINEIMIITYAACCGHECEAAISQKQTNKQTAHN